MKIILCDDDNLMNYFLMHGSGEQKTDNNTQTKIQKMAKKITNSKGNKSFFIMSNIMNFISIESLFYVEWHATKRDFIFYCLTSAYQLKETHAFSHWNYSQNLARIFVCAGDARRTIFLVHLAHYVRRGCERTLCLIHEFYEFPLFTLYLKCHVSHWHDGSFHFILYSA